MMSILWGLLSPVAQVIGGGFATTSWQARPKHHFWLTVLVDWLPIVAVVIFACLTWLAFVYVKRGLRRAVIGAVRDALKEEASRAGAAKRTEGGPAEHGRPAGS